MSIIVLMRNYNSALFYKIIPDFLSSEITLIINQHSDENEIIKIIPYLSHRIKVIKVCNELSTLFKIGANKIARFLNKNNKSIHNKVSNKKIKNSFIDSINYNFAVIHAILKINNKNKVIVCCDKENLFLVLIIKILFKVKCFTIFSKNDLSFRHKCYNFFLAHLSLTSHSNQDLQFNNVSISKSSTGLYSHFDSVIMLTWSDWHTEARSNRYHYATRFSKQYPTLFVMPKHQNYISFERSEIHNLYLLEIPATYDREILKDLQNILVTLQMNRPLCWIYNPLFCDWLQYFKCKITVFHATEAYLSPDFPNIAFRPGSLLYNSLLNCLAQTKLMISVSEGVRRSYLAHANYAASEIVINNGCDYTFYAPSSELLNNLIEKRKQSKIVIYQGNIYSKIDYTLLLEVIKMLPEWNFVFCGKVLFNEVGWKKIIRETNVKYLGIITPEELRDLLPTANVGIMPFTQVDFIKKCALPLKAFEYLASGLPTVSVSIDALLPFEEAFLFADSAEEFKTKIITAGSFSTNYEYISTIMKIAKTQDYDEKFKLALNAIEQITFKNNSLKELTP